MSRKTIAIAVTSCSHGPNSSPSWYPNHPLPGNLVVPSHYASGLSLFCFLWPTEWGRSDNGPVLTSRGLACFFLLVFLPLCQHLENILRKVCWKKKGELARSWISLVVPAEASLDQLACEWTSHHQQSHMVTTIHIPCHPADPRQVGNIYLLLNALTFGCCLLGCITVKKSNWYAYLMGLLQD